MKHKFPSLEGIHVNVALTDGSARTRLANWLMRIHDNGHMMMLERKRNNRRVAVR
jgi:hypothetical protein